MKKRNHQMHRAALRTGAAAAILAALLGLALPPLPAGAAESATGFPDVPAGAWYEAALLNMQRYTPGIIDGQEDADGVLRFHPEREVKRGEFLKMTMTAAEGFTADRSRNAVHWAGEAYTIALENNILIPNAYTGSEPMFPCTFEALEAPVTRYESAVILCNACTNMQMETTAAAGGAASHIADYATVAAYVPAGGGVAGSYAESVEQAFAKGLLTGYEDGAFHGEATLSRCEAAALVYRQLNWKGARQIPDWVQEAQTAPASPGTAAAGNPEASFAHWLQNGHLSGSNPDAEARQRLFGDAAKTGFRSAAEAEPYMESVTVPVWAMDKTGSKFSSTVTFTVNRAVAEEVRQIFGQIYNDPERFPIYGASVGGARYTDTLRHSWGCAIDINPYYNCECSFRSGAMRASCGYGWAPAGMEGRTWMGRDISAYRGSLEGTSPYSIGPESSVVRAFAAYGWGWGGSGSNVPGEQNGGWSGGLSFDFMHFSVLPSGG